MMHKRTEIRLAIAKKIREFTKDNVYLSRPNPLFLPELPCVLIYFSNEDLAISSGNDNFPKAYERILSINVDIIIEGAADPDTALDRKALAIENSFYDDPLFGGLCYGCRLFSVRPISIDSEGDRNIEAQRLTWLLKYESDAFLSRRGDDFLQYRADIVDPRLKDFLVGSEKIVRLK